MQKLTALILLLIATSAVGLPLNFVWTDGHPGLAGETFELTTNGIVTSGIIGTSKIIDVPINQDQLIDAKVRAFPPAGYQCGTPLVDCPLPTDYATLTAILPNLPINISASIVKNAGTIMATDNFTRANSTDLGTNWDEITAGNPNGLDISGNTAVPASLSQDTAETNNTVTWGAAQYSEVTYALTHANGVGSGLGVIVRCASNSVLTYYRAVGNASGYEFARFNAGAFTLISNGSGTTFSAGDTLHLEFPTTGGSWILKKNGTTFASGTDATPVTSGKAGVAFSSASTAGEALSGWAGDNITSGSVSLPPISIQAMFANLMGF